MELKTLHPSNGAILLGVVADDKTFVTAMPNQDLMSLTVDPRRADNPKERVGGGDLQATYEIRKEVQRLFQKEKAKNVAAYSDYMLRLARKEDNGDVPTVILWTDQPLETEVLMWPVAAVQIPFGTKLVAIDGDTQLAARFEARDKDGAFGGFPATVKICFSRPVEWARQSFHDHNNFGVDPNAAVSLAMDMRDPLTLLARELEKSIPFLRGRIDAGSRQLSKTIGGPIFTITALRGAVVTFAVGISGVKHGTSSVPGLSLSPAIKSVALEWFTALTQELGREMEDRGKKIAAAPAVFAALGALGHELLSYEADPVARSHKQAALLERLRGINWSKDHTWESIAGKLTAKGELSVGGTKETVNAVFRAISDPTSQEGMKVRGSAAPRAHEIATQSTAP